MEETTAKENTNHITSEQVQDAVDNVVKIFKKNLRMDDRYFIDTKGFNDPRYADSSTYAELIFEAFHSMAKVFATRLVSCVNSWEDSDSKGFIFTDSNLVTASKAAFEACDFVQELDEFSEFSGMIPKTEMTVAMFKTLFMYASVVHQMVPDRLKPVSAEVVMEILAVIAIFDKDSVHLPTNLRLIDMPVW